MDVAVEHALEIEMVTLLSVLIEVVDFRAVGDIALAADGVERAAIRVHRGEQDPGIGHLALYIFRPIVPIDAHGIDGPLGVVARVEKLHDAGKVVWLARWFAYQIDVVYDGVRLASAG